MKNTIPHPKPTIYLLTMLLVVVFSCKKLKEIDLTNYAIQFDGYDSQMTIKNSESLNPIEAISISMWVRLEAPIDCEINDFELRELLSKSWSDEMNSGYKIKINHDGALHWEVGTQGGVMIYGTGTGLPLDEWTYLTFVYSKVEKAAFIYINGGQDISGGYAPGAYGGSINNNSSDLKLYSPQAENCGSSKGNFRGSIDELSIWSIALTTDQILSNMYDGIDRNESGLISFWPFDDFTSIDKAGANDGTLKGGISWLERKI